jgi:formylglycine-generating enzyme required for sulfatase activity
MKPNHHFDELFARLNDVPQGEILRAAQLPSEEWLPVLRESKRHPAILSEWMTPHRDKLVPSMLRIRDWPDPDIEQLVRDGDLRIGEPTRVKGITIRMSMNAEDIPFEERELPSGGILLTDLAAASAALTETFLVLSAASRPLGQILEPPEMTVSKGSAKFSFGGGLFGAGICLLIIAGDSLIAPPLGTLFGGATLTAVGLIDKWLEWKKKLIEIAKAEAELGKRQAEEKQSDQGTFAHSSLVPREIVQKEAQRFGITEECANHLLNRCVPTAYDLLKRFARTNIEDLADNPLRSTWPQSPRRKPLSGFTDSLSDGSKGPEMLVIPAGTFRMGYIQGNGANGKKPVHTVRIAKPFAMGKYPVTFDEYDKFAAAAGQNKPNDEGWGRGNRPVINVSWDNAKAYTEWLSEQTGEQYSLPTEAEWEYACRAESEAAYCFGDDEKLLEEYAWYNRNAGHKTHPVGQKKPNAWGLHDMHGNVWEWVQDWLGDYSKEPQHNPSGPETGSYRVIRGGSWGDDAGSCRSAYRDDWRPGDRGGSLGFRLARRV